MQHVHDACSDALSDLDTTLFGICNGILADEAAEAQAKKGRFVPCLQRYIVIALCTAVEEKQNLEPSTQPLDSVL